MKKTLTTILLLGVLFVFPHASHAALSASTTWEVQEDATNLGVNGGGFNPNSQTFIQDGGVTLANTSAPVLSSVTYSFVAGDVGDWIFLSTTTKYTGFYKITSLSGSNAVLDATAGHGIIFNNTYQMWQPSTTTGVDSAATLSGKSYGVDYSQVSAAVVSNTDATGVNNSTTFSSAGTTFTPAMIGNLLHITATGGGGHFTIGWYEIISYTDSHDVVLDRPAATGGTDANSGTFYVGGAISLGGASGQSAFDSVVVGGNNIFIKYNVVPYTIGAVITGSGSLCTNAAPCNFIGYYQYRGDNANPFGTATTSPEIYLNSGITFSPAQYHNYKNIFFLTYANINGGSGGIFKNCKFDRVSAGANYALALGGFGVAENDEIISQFGPALSSGSGSRTINNYIHDSQAGVLTSTPGTVVNNLIASVDSYGIYQSNTSSYGLIANNTVYGAETPVASSIGISIITNTGTVQLYENNLIYGFAQGIAQATAQVVGNQGAYNDLYNDTTPYVNYTPDTTDTAVNPRFTSAGQITGTGATSAGTVLTDGSANFNGNVTDNVDFVHVFSGITTPGEYLITSHTNTTLTVNNTLGTGSSIVYNIPNKHNYMVNGNLKAFPGLFPGSSTTGNLVQGSVQKPTSSGFFIQ